MPSERSMLIMSTLEKTISLLTRLPEHDIELIYSYVQFVSSQTKQESAVPGDSIESILENLTGIIPDTGKTLEEYQEERRQERYGITH